MLAPTGFGAAVALHLGYHDVTRYFDRPRTLQMYVDFEQALYASL